MNTLRTTTDNHRKPKNQANWTDSEARALFSYHNKGVSAIEIHKTVLQNKSIKSISSKAFRLGVKLVITC